MNKLATYQWDYVASSNGDGFINITMPIKKWEELKIYVDTHSTKLTDEEIMKIIEKINHTCDPSEIETSYDYEFRIAKAILKKAQKIDRNSPRS